MDERRFVTEGSTEPPRANKPAWTVIWRFDIWSFAFISSTIVKPSNIKLSIIAIILFDALIFVHLNIMQIMQTIKNHFVNKNSIWRFDPKSSKISFKLSKCIQQSDLWIWPFFDWLIWQTDFWRSKFQQFNMLPNWIFKTYTRSKIVYKKYKYNLLHGVDQTFFDLSTVLLKVHINLCYVMHKILLWSYFE